MTLSLYGKVALITGTGGGQGRAAALRFAAAGAHVIGCDLKVEDNIETARLVQVAGGSIVTMQPVNLADPAQSKNWIETAADVHGRIDILYNNASAARFVPFETMSIDDWQWTISNELNLVFYTTRFAWPYLQRQGGVVINTASVAGIAGSGAGGAAHAAAKGAVIAFTKHLAMEAAPHGIRVVAISPGLIASPGTAPILANTQIRDALIDKQLIKRPGLPEDVVGLAVFLAGPDAGFITGSNFVVNGGRIVS